MHMFISLSSTNTIMRLYVTICVIFHINILVNAVNNVNSDANNVILCENEKRPINCEPNKIINILDGSYGRTSHFICANMPEKIPPCTQKITADILKELCDGKNTCELEATNALFGDPCYGTGKYLTVSYECVPKSEFKHQVVCEDEEVNLKCSPFEVVEISRANYGRSNDRICTGGPIESTNCISDVSKNITSELCKNKNSCKIFAKNNVFGDTCFGTHKYLSIKYKCVRKKNFSNKCDNGEIIPTAFVCNGVNNCPDGEDESVCITKTVCETLKLTLKCEQNYKIIIIHAQYGRKGDQLCPNPSNPLINSDTYCYSSNSNYIVHKSCHGKSSCEIQATNGIFGDPCYGIEKYLEVTYTCEPDIMPYIYTYPIPD